MAWGTGSSKDAVFVPLMFHKQEEFFEVKWNRGDNYLQ